MNREVVVVIGAGGIGQAIGRREGTGRQILLADRNEDNLRAAATALQGGATRPQRSPSTSPYATRFTPWRSPPQTLVRSHGSSTLLDCRPSRRHRRQSWLSTSTASP